MSGRRYVGCDSGGNDFSVSTPDQDHPTKQPDPFWDEEVKRYRAQFSYMPMLNRLREDILGYRPIMPKLKKHENKNRFV